MDEPKDGAASPGDNFIYPDDPYGGSAAEVITPTPAQPTATQKVLARLGGGGRTPPPTPPSDEDDNPEEGGMLRMSFLDHLNELRSRLIKAVAGLAVAFFLCVGFSMELWRIVSAPAFDAMRKIGIKDP